MVQIGIEMILVDAIKLYLKELGKEQNQQEAYWLLSHILSIPTAKLVTNPVLMLNHGQQEQLMESIIRRKQGEPLAYIIGEWDFYGNSFYVNYDVLIPRPDSEAIIDWIIEKHPNRKLSLLEIGCGSGALALTLALKRSQWQVSATDISKVALDITQVNMRRLGCDINLYRSDLFLSIPPGKRYDIILANLPYIGTGELLSLQDLKTEPHIALRGGADGLQLLSRLYQGAKYYMKYNASLVVEHGYRQSIMVGAIARREGYVASEKILDLGGRNRGLAVKYIR